MCWEGGSSDEKGPLGADRKAEAALYETGKGPERGGWKLPLSVEGWAWPEGGDVLLCLCGWDA